MAAPATTRLSLAIVAAMPAVHYLREATADKRSAALSQTPPQKAHSGVCAAHARARDQTPIDRLAATRLATAKLVSTSWRTVSVPLTMRQLQLLLSSWLAGEFRQVQPLTAKPACSARHAETNCRRPAFATTTEPKRRVQCLRADVSCCPCMCDEEATPSTTGLQYNLRAWSGHQPRQGQRRRSPAVLRMCGRCPISYHWQCRHRRGCCFRSWCVDIPLSACDPRVLSVCTNRGAARTSVAGKAYLFLLLS